MSSNVPSIQATTSTDSNPMRNRYIDPPQKGWPAAWAWLSEQANPIVVKEARQALGSRQFAISFGFTLLAVIAWTLIAVMYQLPRMYYVPGGLLMLSGYLVILSFPLILVIPFSAFRSMVSEAEERTFELVSISMLSASQIVHGKMYSACLQMTVYLSALAPCIAVTYLLRGVALATILNTLVLTVLMSVGLTAVGILFATVGRARMFQVLSSIILLAGLLWMFVIWSWVTLAMANAHMTFGSTGWQFLLVIGSAVVSGLPMLLRAATAVIDFPSENHALAIRLRILLWIAVLFFWELLGIIELEDSGFCIFTTVVSLILFLLLGALVIGERGVLSARAQRTLPRTQLGRVLLSWLYPGSGLGYVFLCCLFGSITTTRLLLLGFGQAFQLPLYNVENSLAIVWMAGAYFVFFTGTTRLIMLIVPRQVSARLLVGFLLQCMMVVVLGLLPYSAVLVANRFEPFDYDWHQSLNVYWTLEDVVNNGISARHTIALVAVPLLAAAVFVLNLGLSSQDILLVRVQLPQRLQQEIASTTTTPPTPLDPLA
ncbi:MAG: hypothetical protein KF752_16025 [Pirellulaceae bacterium]|nr:hypothetical protein [Pirellulaceae bacterium]